MAVLSRRLALFAGWVAASAAAVVACGIDESGLLASDASVVDGGAKDVVIDVPTDVALPQTCATTDVSCLGFDAGAPDGWAPFVVQNTQCPPGDFASSSWVTNAKVAGGACTCGCTAQGTWSCPTQVTISNGGTCGTSVTVDAGECHAQNPVSQHMELSNPPAATGNGVACAADASAAVAQSDAVVLCAAGCDAGSQAVCSQAAGTRCIAADGVQACPNGLTRHIVGAAAIATCDPCTCKTSDPPTCAATAQIFNGYNQNGYHVDDTCQSGGPWNSQSLNLNNTCQLGANNYESFIVTWNALGAPTCTNAGGGGDAGLTSPKTLCCN